MNASLLDEHTLDEYDLDEYTLDEYTEDEYTRQSQFVRGNFGPQQKPLRWGEAREYAVYHAGDEGISRSCAMHGTWGKGKGEGGSGGREDVVSARWVMRRIAPCDARDDTSHNR